jgi:poly-gamma-glutamate synthesis protein (capsule biosynthesis protein)
MWRWMVMGLLAWSIARAGAPGTVMLSFVGDILLDRGVAKAATAHGTDYLLHHVRGVLTRDDLTIGNLECPVSTRGEAEEKTYTFRADPTLLSGLRDGGLDAVTMANNHALDYGRDALTDTLVHLDHAGLSAAGAGRTGHDARRPLIMARGGGTVALVAASHVWPSTSWAAGPKRAGIAGAYDQKALLARIRTARQHASIVAVYLHWGVEKATVPDAKQRILAHACLDAGADLVIGAHPHVLQGVEYYKGKLIAYSLGNFLFTSNGRTTAILQTTFRDGRLVKAVLLPCRIRDYRPRPITHPDARRKIMTALQARSYHAAISDAGLLTPLPGDKTN